MLLRRSLILLLTLTLPLMFGAACTSDDDLPAADELLESSAEAASGITSTRFVLDVDGTVPGLAVNGVDGVLALDGGAVSAKGTVNAEQIEGEFVLLGDALYFKGATGGFIRLPASMGAQVYDFSAVLDPDRGLANMVRNITDAETVAVDDVAGEQTYQIEGRVSQEAVSGLVPRAITDVDVTLWVSTDGDHLPVRAIATFPADDGAAGGTVTVTLSDVNEPVTIEPPD